MNRFLTGLAFVALMASAPHAVSQAPLDPSIALDLPAQALDIPADGEATLTGTATNTGSVAGTVAMEAITVAGWRVEVEPASAFTLNAGQQVPIVLHLRAPAAGAGESTGAPGLRATLTDAAGRTATSEATVGVTRIDPAIIPPPPTPWYQRTWAAVSALALVLVVATIIGVARTRKARAREAAEATAQAAARVERETGVRMRLLGRPARYGPQRDVSVKVEVRNDSARPRVGLVRVASLPAGWRASLSLSRVPLSSGERVPVTLHVTPDGSATPGRVETVTLACKPEEAVETEEFLDVHMDTPTFVVVTSTAGAVAPRQTLRR